MEFLTLDPSLFEAPKSELIAGPAPMLDWIAIDKLVVDPTYQREIGKRGRFNVRHIAEHFEWSKFAPVIVAPIEGGLYAIVDGQHRSTAAALRGFKVDPCQVVQADRAQQAAAYSAVNGNVTKTTPQQLFHAKLAARDTEAILLQEVCDAGGARVLRRNQVVKDMQVGDTQAVGALQRCLRDYGRDTLITALQCITQTSDGNPGFVRATIIEGLCLVLNERRDWRDAGGALLTAMDEFSFPDLWSEVADGRDQIFPATARKLVADKVRAFLDRQKTYLPEQRDPGGHAGRTAAPSRPKSS